MNETLLFVGGLVTGVIVTALGLFLKGYSNFKLRASMPEPGSTVAFADGWAYWQNENGLYRAPLNGDQPVFKKLEYVDPMTVPADELLLLMEIRSRL